MLRCFALFACCLCGWWALGCTLVGDSDFRVLQPDSGSAGGPAGSPACAGENAPCLENSDCCGFATEAITCAVPAAVPEAQGRCRRRCDSLCREGFRCTLSEFRMEVCVPEDQ